MSKDQARAIRDFKRLKKKLPQEIADRAESYFLDIVETENVSEENAYHCYHRIFPWIAVYKSFEGDANRFEKTQSLFNQILVEPGIGILSTLMKVPFMYKLVPRMAYRMVQKQYKESDDGFQIIYD